MTHLVMVLALLAGGGQAFDPLFEEITHRCSFQHQTWAEIQLPAACEVGGTTRDERIARLARAWKVDPIQAGCALDAFDSERERERDAWLHCLLRYPTTVAFWLQPLRYPLDPTLVDQLLQELSSRGVRGREVIARVATMHRAPSGLVVMAWRQNPGRLEELLDGGDQVLVATAASEIESLNEDSQRAVMNAIVSLAAQARNSRWAAELYIEWSSKAQKRFAAAATSDAWDSRVKLALALISIGRPELAAEIRLAPPRDATSRFSAFLRELLAFHLTGARAGDRWEAAIASTEVLDADPTLIRLALPYIRPHEEILSDQIRWTQRSQTRDDSGETSPFSASQRAARERALALLPQEPTVERPAIQAPSTLSLVPSVWKERATPWNGQPNAAVKATLPPGQHAVRIERQGKRIVALSLSQNIDPVGEVSGGAAWLMLSVDEGETWREIYLSLGDFRPFHALLTSEVPLIDANDVVRVDVEDAPIDEGDISFPPVGRRPTPKRAQVILEAPLSVLVRDTDGDGLSDLVEKRMLLDSARADSDGDGVSDAADLMPRLDDRSGPTSTAMMLDAFFGRERGGPRLVVPPELSGRCRFLIGDAQTLAGIHPPTRTVTLNRNELEAAKRVFGTFYPMDLTIVLNGKDHAYIRFNESWRGGSVRIDRNTAGELIITQLSDWIT